jgi:hypothetical protein
VAREFRRLSRRLRVRAATLMPNRHWQEPQIRLELVAPAIGKECALVAPGYLGFRAKRP